MSTVLVAIVVAALSVSSPLPAQQFSAEEQSVIDHVKACWTAWGEEDTSVWEGACLTDPGVRFWWMNEGVPSYGPAEWKRWAEAFFPRIEASVYFEHRPIAVQIFGDTAVYQYWATWTQVDADGQHLTQPERRLDILQQRNGGWVFIGGAGVSESGGQ